LTWQVPVRTAAGEPAPTITGYRIYGRELRSSVPSASPEELPQGKPESHAALLASAESNNYRDTSVVFDHTYVYMVRSVIQVEGDELESSDSQPVKVIPHDTFPPPSAGPRRRLAAWLGPGTVLIDLSWSINLETDLAAIASIEVSRRAQGASLSRRNCCPRPRFVIGLYSPADAIGTP